ncbi:MAG: NUDIX domain-containing protein, partial [bacterium]|nr:NUDIX domain-containing protein [bacterium]
MENKRPQVGVGVIISKDDKILFNKRKGSFASGEYGTTGGHLEFGESFGHGIMREIEEENGLKIKNLKWLHVANIIKYAPEHFIDITFTADWESGHPIILEPGACEQWLWQNPDTVTFPILEPSKLALQALKDPKFN